MVATPVGDSIPSLVLGGARYIEKIPVMPYLLKFGKVALREKVQYVQRRRLEKGACDKFSSWMSAGKDLSRCHPHTVKLTLTSAIM